MQINDSAHYPATNNQSIYGRNTSVEPTSTFAIEKNFSEMSYLEKFEVLARRPSFIGSLTIYDDDKVLIQINNKNELTNITWDEVEAMGWANQVYILCKVTNTTTVIEDVEMVESFYKTLSNFLEKNNLSIQDFMEYAKSKLLGELFDSFMEEMGWKVSHHTVANETYANNEDKTVIDNRYRNNFMARQTSNQS